MNWVRALTAFDENVIERRLRQALRRNDRRLLATRSYSLYPTALEIPSVELSAYVACHGFRAIRGTSDLVRGVDQMAFVRSAFRFAERYNQRLVSASRSEKGGQVQ